MDTLHEMGSRLEEYCSRNLSHGKDALRAIEGVLNTFIHAGRGNSRAVHFYGIPIVFQAEHSRGTSDYNEIHSFAKGLLWSNTFKEPSAPSIAVEAEHTQIGLPTWSWAAIKSKYPNAAMYLRIFASQSPLKQDLTVRFARRGDSKTLTLSEVTMALKTEPYTNFSSIIEITTWALEFPLRFRTDKFLNLAPFDMHNIVSSHTVFMDDMTKDSHGQLVHLLFMGYNLNVRPRQGYGIEALLVRTCAGGVCKRIGKWEAFVAYAGQFQGETSDFEGLLNTLLGPGDSEQDARWQRQAFTIG